MERGIVVEKAGVNTLSVVATFQLEEAAIEATLARAGGRSWLAAQLASDAPKRMPDNPFRAIDDRPVMHPYHARRYAKSIGQEVPLDQAVGRVAAEAVEVYPPGIPVILEGFRVSEDAVAICARRATWAAPSSRATRRSRRYASSDGAPRHRAGGVEPARPGERTQAGRGGAGRLAGVRPRPTPKGCATSSSARTFSSC